MKKSLAFLLASVLVLALLPSVGLAASAPTGDGVWFYANGTPVTITDTAPAGATHGSATGYTEPATPTAYISWVDGGTTYYVNADATTRVCGGGIADFTNTSVTMESGRIARIYGGSREKEISGTTNVTMNGGTVDYLVGGGYAGNAKSNVVNMLVTGGTVTDWMFGGCQALGAGNATMRVNTVNITVNDASGTAPTIACLAGTGINPGGNATDKRNEVGSVTMHISAGNFNDPTFGIFGGGQGYCFADTVTINFSGGTVAAGIHGGGQNGSVGSATVNISGGTVHEVSACFRGTVDDFTVNMTGGSVDEVYAGNNALEGSSVGTSNNGSITNSATLNLTGGTVGNVYLGGGLNGSPTDPGVAIPSTEPVKTVVVNAPNTTVSTNPRVDVTTQELNASTTLTVAAGSTLQVPQGATLTNNGSIINNGSVDNQGTIDLASAGGAGSIVNNEGSTYSGNDPVGGELKYHLSVQGGTGTGDYAAGETVTLTATPSAGQKFKEWTVSPSVTFTEGSATTTTAKFAMLTQAVSATATYEAIPAPAGPTGYSSLGGSTYTGNEYPGSLTGGALTVQGPCANLTSVMVDNVILTREVDYTVQCGSTIVTFTPAYLATLRDGAHTVKVQFTDGRYMGTFTTPIASAVTAPIVNVPATNGPVPAAAFVWVLCGACCLVARMMVYRRRD